MAVIPSVTSILICTNTVASPFVHGQHTFKTGGDFGIDWLATPRYEPAGPSFNFGPNFTQGPNPVSSTDSGVGVASWLVGTGSGSSSSGGPNQYLSSRYYGFLFSG